jgi:hypothetical protein
MIQKIGFFHFVTSTDPVETLEAEIQKKDEGYVTDALVVLPEAFNIGVPYWGEKIERDPPKTEPIVLFKLQKLCERFTMSLVAGLIIKTPNGPDPPYSSAYLIDSEGFGLLCHKMGDDRTAVRQSGGETCRPNYTRCPDGCDAHNVTIYRNLAIAALICMDAFVDYKFQAYCANEERHERLNKMLTSVADSGARSVVCVPGRIKCGQERPIAGIFHGSYIIVANSPPSPDAPGSYVAKIDGEGAVKQLAERQGNTNDVIVVPLDATA